MAPERTQVARVARAARRRDDAARARAALDGVRAARATARRHNIMEAVLEAARRDATLGEICRVFRDVFGEYRDPAECVGVEVGIEGCRRQWRRPE